LGTSVDVPNSDVSILYDPYCQNILKETYQAGQRGSRCPDCHAGDETWDYPSLGGAISIPLTASDRRENFLLDIRKGRIDLSKGSYQNRSRQVIVLVRLDFGGSIHRNPDNTEVACPHLHVYREGYGDKWAMSLPGKIRGTGRVKHIEMTRK
jgi:hypothetical protein